MNNPFPWFGSKARLSKWIINLMPNHEGYAELFGGTGSVLLRKPPSKIEIFNDINNGITNFFSVVRDNTKTKILKKKLLLTPYNERDFHLFKDGWKNQQNDVEKAFQWYYVAQLSFSGIWSKGPRFALESQASSVPATIQMYLSSIDNLELLYNRIRNVQILNRDWKKCFNLCNSKDFLIYLDPPYIPATRIDGFYPNEMSPENHEELVDKIVDSKAMIILSGYGHSIYDDLLKNKWKKITKEVRATCSHDVSGFARKGIRTECLYFNNRISKILT